MSSLQQLTHTQALSATLIQFYLTVTSVHLSRSSYMEALMYLIYAYQYNKELLSKGLYRGHDEELLGFYRRECLLVRECTQPHSDTFY